MKVPIMVRSPNGNTGLGGLQRRADLKRTSGGAVLGCGLDLIEERPQGLGE